MMDSLLSWFLAVFLCLFLTTSSYSQSTSKPRVTYDGDSMVLEGDPFQISCQVTIFDSVKWQKDGRTLYPDVYNNYTLLEEVNGGVVLARLSVVYANVFHTGNYRCNSFSNDFHQIYVLSANPSQGQIEYVQIKYKQKTATLYCPIPTDIQLFMKWLKEGTAIDVDSSNEFDIDSDNEGSKLLIKSAFENGYGNYSCQMYHKKNYTLVDTMTKYFVVISELTLKMEEAATVIEGAELKLRCLVTSRTPPFQMKWRFGNETYEASRDRVTLMPDDKGIPNAMLKIDAAVMSDRGTFTCMGFATPVANATEIETYVRVKDKYAALWPFLGICAEVLILCTIILIYEKKRNKAELEESDTDQSPDQKNTPDMGKDSVRQRK